MNLRSFYITHAAMAIGGLAYYIAAAAYVGWTFSQIAY